MGAIGRLGLAVVGGFIGGPVGFALGSLAGGLLFPERIRLPDQTGPRLGESQLTGSEYGRGIPKIWGTYRVSGNIIWASPVREVKRSTTHRHRQGKGGGPETRQTVHEFFYYQSFALALCEGEAKRVTKIFFDGKVVYDMTSTTGGSVKQGVKFRFYPGTEDQLPDSIIESYEGGGNVPAHRGLCYLVFDNLDITNYRRIPAIEVHVQMVGADGVVTRQIEGRRGQYGAVSLESRAILTTYGSDDKNKIISLDDLELIRERNEGEEGSIIAIGPAPGGDFFAVNSGRAGMAYLVDSATLQIKKTLSGLPQYPYNARARYASFKYYGLLGDEHLIFLTAYRHMLSDTDRVIARDVYGNADMGAPSINPWRGYRFCHAYLDKCYIIANMRGDGSRFAIFETGIIEEVSVGLDGKPYLTLIVTAEERAQFTTTDIDPDGRIPYFWGPSGVPFADLNDACIDGVVYDFSDDSLLMSFGRSLVTVKIRCSDWSIKWRFVADPDAQIINYDRHRYDLGIGHDISAGTWFVHRGPQGQAGGYLIDTSTGRIIKEIERGLGYIHSEYVYDSRNKAAAPSTGGLLANPPALYFDRAPSDRVPIPEILEDLREEVDAVPSDYSAIAGVEVDGYARMSPTTARSMIEPLATTFGFDAVDVGTHLRWIRRGGGSIVNVARDDLIPSETEVIEYQRAQEVELPRLVSITYADITRDFEQSTYHASRYYGNEQYTTMHSANQVRIEAPMAIEATEVKRRADTLMREAWNSRDTAKFSIPRYFLEHEVGDVVTLMSPGRVPQDVRLDGFVVGSNLAIEINATSQDSSQYTSIVEAERGQGFVDQTILSSRDLLTRLFMLPVPLLLDSSDRARQEMLVQYAMGAVSPNWKSGVLEHDLGAGFMPVGSVQTDAVHGSIIGQVPPADPDTVFATDEDLTIRVVIATGTLESVTQEEMLAGANAAAIIHSDSRAEVIQFRDAVLDADGNYTLSGILRGRRGTDSWAQSFNSPIGATFIELTPDAVSATTAPLSELGRSRLYRGHEIRQEPENGDTRSARLLGIEMRPYAPVHLTYSGNIGEDITMHWERRTRLRGDLSDNTDIVPLNEDDESYEIDVVIAGAVVRTIHASEPSAIYTQAQQVEDGATQPNVFVQIFVYQMSEQVGRGFPSQPITLGAALEVAQFAPMVITNVPPPDIELSQQNVLFVQPTEPSVLVAQLGVLVFGPPPVNNEDDGQVAQHSQLIISDVRPLWEVAQYNKIVVLDAPATGQ